MARPHEDFERHTNADHRAGGPPVAFAAASWCAIVTAHTAAGRSLAEVSALETMIEKALVSAVAARSAAIFRSANGRRVTAMIELDGHEAFRHLEAAWDDRHLRAARHDAAESFDLGLFRATANAGIEWIDPSSTDACALEHVAREPRGVAELIGPAAGARGFRGTRVFGSEGGKRCVILYRFEHKADIADFRGSEAGRDILGAESESGESLYDATPVRTFA